VKSREILSDDSRYNNLENDTYTGDHFMFMRTVIAIGAICLTALPVLAQTPKPTVMITAKPISRLLSEYREMIRQVGGPSAGDNLVMAFDDKLKEQLGESGF
jgi:hypothetical protein